MCFVWIWEQTAIISLHSINWLVCITETECVYGAVWTGSLYIIQVKCFVLIWEQTAIISLYSIKWPVFVMEADLGLCEVQTAICMESGTFHMAQAVSRQVLTEEVHVRSPASPCKIC